MLAGKMKLNHFLLIVAGVGAAGIAVAFLTCGGGDGEDAAPVTSSTATDDTAPTRADMPEPEPRAGEVTRDEEPGELPTRRSNPRPLADTLVDTPSPDGVDPASDLRDVDRELLSWAGKDLGRKKIKDARKGRGYKINLYQDAGKTSINRAKVDLDRDDKWDEKWTFDGTNVSRKVAPADDENYTRAYDWSGEAWVLR